jgi:endonuclease/exonuclease/phosphatase family metal-dependent hydrolase
LFDLALPNQTLRENKRYSKDEYEKKIAWTARQLAAMDAGIVGLQEVFHKAALHEAVKKSRIYYKCPIFVSRENGNSPAVGLVSRYPVDWHESIANFPPESLIMFDNDCVPISQFRCPLLKAKIMLPNKKPIIVFVVHLKSKRPLVEQSAKHDAKALALGKAKSIIVRAAEAAALRCILIDELKNNQMPVVVLGDLNDTGQSVTTNIITDSPPSKKLAVEKRRSIWDQFLYTAADLQLKRSHRDVYYTHLHDGHHESLDHILLSEEFSPTNPKRIGFFEYMRVFNDHLIDQKLANEEIPIWQSDHGQVIVSIELY